MSGIAGYYDINLKRWVSPEFSSPARGGVAAPAPVGVRPAQAAAQPQAGQQAAAGGSAWQRPWRERFVLVDIVQDDPDGDTTTGTARARILVPDPRLIVGATLGFEPVTPVVISSYTSSAWSATLVRPAAQSGGRECDLHALWTSETLPQGRAVASLVGELAISAALTVPTASGQGVPGQWVLEVTAVAGVPMCPEEIAELYNAIAVRVIKKFTFDIAES